MQTGFYSLLLLLFVSCQSIVEKRASIPASQQSRQMLKQAKINFEKKDFQSALELVDQIIVNDTETDIADNAMLLKADILKKLGKFKQALKTYQDIPNSPYYSDVEGEALISASEIYFEFENHQKALENIKSAFNTGELDKSLQKRAQLLRVDIFIFKQNYLEALTALIDLSQLQDKESLRDAYQMRAIDITQSKLNREDLMIVASKSRFQFLRPIALFRLGNTFFEEGDFSRSKEYLRGVVRLDPQSSYAERSKNLIELIDSRSKVKPYTIGVVLPLSGYLKKIGYDTLKGIQLSLGIFDKERSKFRLAVIDSESSPDIAGEAVERLVVEDNAIAIIGSLISKTSTSVAKKAQELGVPSIALSQKSGLPEVGPYVFRNALTSEMQIQKLVETAMNNLGMKRFAILFPNDPYGVEFSNLFWDAVHARGGQIVGAQSYDPEETDFRAPVQRLVGTYYREDRLVEYQYRLRKYREKNPLNLRNSSPTDLLPPIVDFDAIFIPDSARAVGQIAPMLDYNDVKGMMLLGTNLWNSRNFIKRIGKHGNSTIFVDSLADKDNNQIQKKFERDFLEQFNEKPNNFSAQAYDVGRILRQMIESGTNTRVRLRDKLASSKAFNGVMGPLEMSKGRELLRPITSLTIKEGQVVRAE